jgi:hypothetical protein
MTGRPNLPIVAPSSDYRTPPHNIEAEQALLGAISSTTTHSLACRISCSRSIFPKRCINASTRSPRRRSASAGS